MPPVRRRSTVAALQGVATMETNGGRASITGTRPRAGEGAVNGFHVHAIGWVLVANGFTLPPAAAHELSDLWTDLVRLRSEDLCQAHPLLGFLFPRGLPLSPATRAALAALVERMAAQHPERFGAEALRQRRNHWLGQALLGILLSGLAAILVPPSLPWAATAVPTFFLMGCVCLLPTVTLWRAATAVHECHTQSRVVGHRLHKLSRPFRLR